jgi:hypothetical protein
MRSKVVLTLCSTMIALGATAQAGWWHHHRHCHHCGGYGYGAAPVSTVTSGGGFASASGEAYVVRTVPERVRYYAVSERLLADPLEFRSARSTEEIAKEAARAEFDRIEAERARFRESARAESSQEADITTIVQGISLVFELLDRIRVGRRGEPLDGGSTDCEAEVAELRRQVRELQRGRAPTENSTNGGASSRRSRPSFNPGRENSTGGNRADDEALTESDSIKQRAEQLADQRAQRLAQLEKELEILKSITITVPPQPPPQLQPQQ